MASTTYKFIHLETFDDSLSSLFGKRDQQKIMDKVHEMINFDPTRYPMLKGKITIRGVKLAGLRHMKVGVAGIRGGAYVLYRFCKECKEQKYHLQSDIKCQFCSDKTWNHIVLFDVRPRSFGY